MSKDPEVSKKEIRHKIGLSLGGDLCWPACYETTSFGCPHVEDAL